MQPVSIARVSPSAESSRDFWTFIRQLTGKTRKEPCSILIDPVSQRTVSSAVEKATLLNNFFVKQTMLDIPSNCKPDTASLRVNPNSFTFLETTPTEVYKILSTLKTNKAAGLDNIPAGLLKFCAPGISKSLTCLFNRSFELSEFPTAWKEATQTQATTDPSRFSQWRTCTLRHRGRRGRESQCKACLGACLGGIAFCGQFLCFAFQSFCHRSAVFLSKVIHKSEVLVPV